MLVPVMRIRKVRVSMREGVVAMPMTVPGARRHCVRVSMLVVFVVRMLMFMLKRFVAMFVLVPLGQMQPHA